jgi:hypothetical protein
MAFKFATFQSSGHLPVETPEVPPADNKEGLHNRLADAVRLSATSSEDAAVHVRNLSGCVTMNFY